MSSQEQQPVTGAAAAALGFLVAGLVVLGFGRFVQFDNSSGYGSDQWVLPLGYLAAVLATVAVGVASADRIARLWLGGALAVLDVFLVWQTVTNQLFRFVWGGDEGELFLFEIALALIALLLIASGLQPLRHDRAGAGAEAKAGAEAGGKVGAGRWLVRTAVYLAGIVVAVIVGFFIGVRQYEARYCHQAVDSCEPDDLTGLVWGANGSLIALGICLVVIVATELVLRSRRQQQRKVGTPT